MDIRPCGDGAFVIRLAARPSRALAQRLAALRHALVAARPPGLLDAIVGLATLTVIYEPDAAEPATLVALVRDLMPAHAAAGRRRCWRLPVCYEGDFAPDLPEVAAATGLAPEDVVRLHAARRYTVYLLGFSPGFPYLGDLEPRLALPRRSNPRPRVPAGAVAIATAYTAIYPQETPGGWHIIGRTPVRLFDPDWKCPALLAPGDDVRFVPVTTSAFEALVARVRDGTFAAACESETSA